MNRSTASAAAFAVGIVACVVAANWATTSFGLIAAGFGLLVPAGTYLAGATLALRDGLHDTGGIRWVAGAIAAGIAVSFLVADPRIAVASAVAFGVAELLDLAVYAPLRKRAWMAAVAVSNLIGGVADTVLFLAIAGFPITSDTVAGQLLVKAVWVTAAYLILGGLVRRALLRHRVEPAGA